MRSLTVGMMSLLMKYPVKFLALKSMQRRKMREAEGKKKTKKLRRSKVKNGACMLILQ